MEFKGKKGEWYKMDAERMGVPFIIASGNETIFQAYGEDAEHNVNLTLCAPEMLEALKDCLMHFESYKQIVGDKNNAPDWLIKQIEELIKKATTI